MSVGQPAQHQTLEGRLAVLPLCLGSKKRTGGTNSSLSPVWERRSREPSRTRFGLSRMECRRRFRGRGGRFGLPTGPNHVTSTSTR